MQIELFDDTEIMSNEEIQKKEGREYTACSIFRSSGHGREIQRLLVQNETEKAFQLFDKAFRTYGFGCGKYSFITPTIRVNNFEFNVTTKELFQTLLDLKSYESTKRKK